MTSLLAGACSDDDSGGEAPPERSGEPAPWAVRSSVEQLIIADAAPSQELAVLDGSDAVVAKVVADDAGNAIVRELEPGAAYRVADGEDPALASEPTEVWAVDDAPEQGFYDDQDLTEGYQYVEVRDGTLLAVNVTLPGPVEDGPYPTLVEYSGYDPANPEQLQPLQTMANLLGYATVGVNMRGTGCSGGSFLFFEPAQWTDGYDVIEAVAAQPWSTGKVGMIGISYPGISQLFVAQTQPPSLAAITPLSVIDDTYRSTLYPGGILNNGFATAWAEGRQNDGAAFGQGWSQDRADDGDDVCVENQAYRTQNPDLFEFIDDAAFVPEDRDSYIGRLAPSEWVDQIEVPVLIAGAWQDEQTGGHFPAMLDRFTGAPVARFLLTNGGHTEALGPELILAFTEFLDLYVAERVPALPEGVETPLNLLGGAVFGVPLELPPERFTGYVSYEEALAAYEAEPSVRILFENGGLPDQPGAPYPTFSASFDAWPIPEAVATTWHLGVGGTLTDAPGADGVEVYDHDSSRSQQNTLAEDGNPWEALPAWQWDGPPDGTALAYASAPLDETLVMAGSGRIDLWLGSTAPDVDLQVTLSEIRPDGTEVYVQSGWLRASHRQLDADRTTPLRPYHTHLERDAEPLPAGELAEVNVELFPFAHVFRAGSQLRLVVDNPGGSRPEWRFDALDAPAGTVNRIGLGAATPSRITLPVIAVAGPPEAPPPCPSLRGQPCRPLSVVTNRSGS